MGRICQNFVPSHVPRIAPKKNCIRNFKRHFRRGRLTDTEPPMSRTRTPFGERSSTENAAPLFSPARGKSPGATARRPGCVRTLLGTAGRRGSRARAARPQRPAARAGCTAQPRRRCNGHAGQPALCGCGAHSGRAVSAPETRNARPPLCMCSAHTRGALLQEGPRRTPAGNAWGAGRGARRVSSAADDGAPQQAGPASARLRAPAATCLPMPRTPI